MTARTPRVAVVYNEPVLPADHPEAHCEHFIVAVATAVVDGLNASGFEAMHFLAVPPIGDCLARLERTRADIAFSLIERFGGVVENYVHLTAALELLGLAYTGAGVEALAFTRSKAVCKALLRGHGLPTAASVLIRPGEPIPRFDGQGPVLVKPDTEDGSLGIHQESVVTDPALVADRVERLHRELGSDVLVETYLPGPEFNVGVIAFPEPRALPVAQVIYEPRSGVWPILTYAAKWHYGSEDDLTSPIACPAPIEPALADRLKELAVSAYRATRCRDYARVDIRLDARGEPMILEVNPNPDLDPGAGFARAAQVAGFSHAEVVAAIARQALARRGRSGPIGAQATTSNQTAESSSTTPL